MTNVRLFSVILRVFVLIRMVRISVCVLEVILVVFASLILTIVSFFFVRMGEYVTIRSLIIFVFVFLGLVVIIVRTILMSAF